MVIACLLLSIGALSLEEEQEGELVGLSDGGGACTNALGVYTAGSGREAREPPLGDEPLRISHWSDQCIPRFKPCRNALVLYDSRSYACCEGLKCVDGEWDEALDPGRSALCLSDTDAAVSQLSLARQFAIIRLLYDDSSTKLKDAERLKKQQEKHANIVGKLIDKNYGCFAKLVFSFERSFGKNALDVWRDAAGTEERRKAEEWGRAEVGRRDHLRVEL